MKEYKPWVIRAISVFGMAVVVILLLAEYAEYGLETPFTTHLPRLLLIFAVLLAMLVKTFFAPAKKTDKAAVRAGFDDAAAAFAPTEKKAKKACYRGFAALCDDRHRTADRCFKRALKAAKTPRAKAQILTYLGMSLREQGRYNEALQALEQATGLDKACMGAWCQTADVYASRDDFVGAKRVCETAVTYCPQCGALFSRMGRYAFLLGDYESALRDFSTAQQLDPASAMLAANIATAYAALGDANHARAAYEHACVLQYDNCQALAQRIESLLRAYEARRVPFYGVYVLETAEGERIEGCTAEDLYTALQNVWNKISAYLVLTPPAPIANVLFMQTTVSENGPYVQISVGENRIGTLYEKYCSAQEVEQMFMRFLTEHEAPSLYGFTELPTR